MHRVIDGRGLSTVKAGNQSVRDYGLGAIQGHQSVFVDLGKVRINIVDMAFGLHTRNTLWGRKGPVEGRDVTPFKHTDAVGRNFQSGKVTSDQKFGREIHRMCRVSSWRCLVERESANQPSNVPLGMALRPVSK